MTSQPPRAEARGGFSHFRHLLAACIATRLVVDTSIQLFFSFLQVIALGMGLNVVVLGRMLSLRSAVGLSAPLFGSAADRYGYLRVMRLALVLCAAGTFLLGSGGGFWSVAAGMIVSGCRVDRLHTDRPGLHQRATALFAARARHRYTGVLLGLGGDFRPVADGAPFRPFQLAAPLHRPGRGDARRLGTPRLLAKSVRRRRTCTSGGQ